MPRILHLSLLPLLFLLLLHPALSLKINCGGDYVEGFEPDNPQWLSETPMSRTFSTPQTERDASGARGVLGERFWTHRFTTGDQPLIYTIPVAPGPHRVELQWAEVYAGTQSAGTRLMEAAVNGFPYRIRGIDVFVQAGGAYRPLIKRFWVDAPAANPVVRIELSASVQNPFCSAIVITPLHLDAPASPAPATDEPAPTEEPPEEQEEQEEQKGGGGGGGAVPIMSATQFHTSAHEGPYQPNPLLEPGNPPEVTRPPGDGPVVVATYGE